MPLFGSEFLQKKILQRKLTTPQARNVNTQEYLFFDPTVKLNLGISKSVFDKGQWISKSGPLSEIKNEKESLRKAIIQLEEENNLLKLKNEILLDMLTQESIKCPEPRAQSLQSKALAKT